MKVKALVSFSGAFSMYKGETKDISDEAILQDLLQAEYIEEVQEGTKKVDKKVKTETTKVEEDPKEEVKSSESK